MGIWWWSLDIELITKDMQFGLAFCQFCGKSNDEKIMTKPPDGTRLSAIWPKTAGTSNGDLACWEHHRTGGNLHLLCLITGVWDVDWGTSWCHVDMSDENMHCLKASPSTRISNLLLHVKHRCLPTMTRVTAYWGDGSPSKCSASITWRLYL